MNVGGRMPITIFITVIFIDLPVNILENNDVIDVDGNVIGKRTNDGLIIDNYGELAGVEEIKKTSAETLVFCGV